MAAPVLHPLACPTLSKTRSPIPSAGQGLHRRQSSSLPRMKRSTRESAAPSQPIPRATCEWKEVLASAKRHHASRRFHQCFAVCQDFLNLVKPQMNIEPAYLIYLNFYAANALEAQARDIQALSSRKKLLMQAREYYQHASSLLSTEETINARPSWRFTSPAPELHSPVDSTSSRSTISSRASSPDSSILRIGRPLIKHKKRVTFQEDPVAEPIVRPDSPTLGFDEWLGRSSPDPVPDLVLEPLLTTAKPASSPVFSSVFSSPDSSPLAPIVEEEMSDPFVLVRSVHRYCTILTDLQRQIASHMASIDADLSTTELPGRSLPESEELRALELRTRIERLRANGWQRPRFDAQKYRRLRENAMADLTG